MKETRTVTDVLLDSNENVAICIFKQWCRNNRTDKGVRNKSESEGLKVAEYIEWRWGEEDILLLIKGVVWSLRKRRRGGFVWDYVGVSERCDREVCG